MAKKHLKNGFEYECERFFVGRWHTQWKFKPVDEIIFVSFCNGAIGKSLKKDLESLLSTSQEAKEYYYRELHYMTDIEKCQRELKIAQQRYDRINSTDFDIRGNNPDKEFRVQKEAYNILKSAENRLQKAIGYNDILKKHNKC